jgi:hypothetical protein
LSGRFTLKCSPRWSAECTPAGVEEDAALLVAQEGVVVEAVPELLDDLDVLAGAGVAEGMRVLLIEVEVVRRGLGRRRHHVPAGPPARDQVERGEPARGRIRLFVGARGGGDEAEMLGQRRERR